MQIKIILHITLISLIFSCSREYELNGHWHEYINGNDQIDNCYIITDSTISINKFTLGSEFHFNSKKQNIWDFIPYSDNIDKTRIIYPEKISFSDNTKWVKKQNNHETFKVDFSAGYKVIINPPKSTLKENSLIKYHNNRHSILLVLGQIKHQYVDLTKGLQKEKYYFQINGKLTNNKNDLLDYILCTHCQLEKIDLFINMDVNTPIELKQKLNSIISFLGLRKNQVYYLTVDLNNKKRSYKNYIVNHFK